VPVPYDGPPMQTRPSTPHRGPSAHVTWFEDAMHDIPLQRPAELAELARFAEEVSGRG
jgi:hypothetical protein